MPTIDLNDREKRATITKEGLTLSRSGNADNPSLLCLSIKGNPTTGYTWNVDDAATNGAFEVMTRYISDNQVHQRDVPLCGAGGTYYFTLTPLAEGANDGVFSISEGRDWEDFTIDDVSIPVKILD